MNEHTIISGIVLFLVIMLFYSNSESIKSQRRTKKLKKLIKEYPNCHIFIAMASKDVEFARYIIDKTNLILYVFYSKSDSLISFMIKDILSCKITLKEDYLTKTDNTSLVLRAVLGNFLWGKAGAIIGGTTARKSLKQKDFYEDGIIDITLSNPDTPLVRLEFAKGESCINEDIRLFHATIKACMHKAKGGTP